MASSSEIKHDVFLSFRGKDTRRNFTGHLHAALTRNCIDAFIDGGGEGISETLFNKISESLVSVVIFSLNYADSPWCLDELVKVVECRQKMGQTVLPVFLGVEPTHVRKQTGPFGDAFNRLVQNPQFKDREEIWKRALVETANLSGWDSEAKSQDKIVEEIVNRIEKILDQMSLRDQYDGFVGISRVEKVESLLCIGSTGRVCSIGIWGMGGIGKTTIARLLFYRLSHTFNGACFVGHVRAKVEREGLGSVQKDMILQLLGVKSTSAGPYMLSPAICRKLKRKKLLIVLDDVHNPRQLKALVGREDFYGQGSRIIVTSRDKQVLKNGCSRLYEVQKLNQRESLQLFKLHAFRQDQPTTKFIELSKKAMLFAQGLPLAIEVLGCNLYGRDMKEWEIELSKLEEIPNLEVTDILRISYDGLDEKEKSIFLDIACIFQGSMKDHVESILDGCGFFAGIGLSRLFDKALITVSKGTLWMHDLLQQMGQDIVLHECLEEPGKRSRLWRWKDIDDVLTKSMVNLGSLNFIGTPEILCLVSLKELDLQASNLDSLPASIKQLPNLRLLLLNNCKKLTCLPELPSSLQWLGTANCTILESVHSLPRGDHSRGPGFVFDFYNCINLDGNTRIRLMTDAWQRVEIFVVSVQESANKGSHGGGSDEEDGDEYQVWDSDEEDPCDDRAFLVMPGSKVPEWFEYSTFGSSLTIKLFDGRLMDPCPFAFFLVVASNRCEQRSLWVQCKCTLVTESGEYYSRICGNSSVWDSRYHGSPMDENVILWYGGEQVQVQGPSPICFTEAEATFEFYASDYETVQCGVTPVGNICNRFKGLPLVQHGNPGDEDEQSRKRFKKNV